MSTRRPRVKAIANLVAPRRFSKTDNKSINENDDKTIIADNKNVDVVSNEVTDLVDEVNNLNNDEEKSEKETATTEIVNNSNTNENDLQSANNQMNRRRIKASVNLPKLRKSKPTNSIKNSDSLIINNNNQSIEEETINDENEQESSSNVVTTQHIEEPLPIVSKVPPNLENDDSVFKSPTYYPNIRTNNFIPNNRPNLTLNTDITPLSPHDNNNLMKDDLRCPLSPTKIRQRIKATPFFGNRRNSIQGRDEIEDFPRRQRHTSTSSTHSNQSSNINIKHISSPLYLNGSRHRTESCCSNASDISMVKEMMSGNKKNRSHRNEESTRIADAKRDFRNRFSGATPDKTQLTMYDMIYYNPVTNPMKNPAIKKEKDSKSSTASSASSYISKIERPPTPLPVIEKKDEESAMPVPQLKIGPNGEIMIDEKSLVIETTRETEAKKTLANADIIYDDEFGGTHGFYRRHQRTRDWLADETIKFYRCLHTIGTDFSLMLSLFPQRTRRDLKLKFKKEEKNNIDLINKALLNPKSFNIEDLEADLKRDEEIIRAKEEAMKKLREQFTQNKAATTRCNIKANPQKTLSKSIRALTGGECIYENEDLIVKKPRIKRKFHKINKTNTKIKNPFASNINNEIENMLDGSISPLNDERENEQITIQNNNENSKLNENNIIEKLPCFNEVLKSPINKNKFSDFQILVKENGKEFLSNEIPVKNVQIEVINYSSDCEIETYDNVVEKNQNTEIILEESNQIDKENQIELNENDESTEVLNDSIIVTNNNIEIDDENSSDSDNLIIDDSCDNSLSNETQSYDFESISTEDNVNKTNEESTNEIITTDSNSKPELILPIEESFEIINPESSEIIQENSNEIKDDISPKETLVIDEIESDKQSPSSDEPLIPSPPKKLGLKRKKPQINLIDRKRKTPKVQNEEEKQPVESVVEMDEIIDNIPQMDNLVAATVQDPNDPTKISYEIYVMCPKTGQLSEEPLDLSKDVIENIVKCIL